MHNFQLAYTKEESLMEYTVLLSDYVFMEKPRVIKQIFFHMLTLKER
jgi:hypothetical protein